jgi:hypothetical protein
MKSEQPILMLLVGTLLALAIGWFLIDKHYQHAAGAAYWSAVKTLPAEQKTHVSSMRDLEAEHYAKLHRAWGGQPESWAKNPELSIVQMLEKVAIAAAPAKSGVHVIAEEFLFFRVRVDLNGPVKMTQVAHIVRAVLAAGQQYVDSLELVGKNSKNENPVRILLDRDFFQNAQDWKLVSLDETKELLRKTRWFEGRGGAK